MKKVIAALMLMASPAAFAELLGSVDGFYIPKAEIEAGAKDDGDGFGVRATIDALPMLTLTGEYRSVGYDDSNADYDQTRLGAGFGIPLAVARITLLGEYMDGTVEAGGSESDLSGFGVHGRVSTGVIPMVTLYGQVGYLMTELESEFFEDDFTGTEINLGAVYHATKLLGVLVDWRHADLEGDDSGSDLTFTDISIGARIGF